MLKLLLLANLVYAHSGGTDAEGCHNDSSTGKRHCHDDNNSSSTSTSISGGFSGSYSLFNGKIWPVYLLSAGTYVAVVVTGESYMKKKRISKDSTNLMNPNGKYLSYLMMYQQK